LTAGDSGSISSQQRSHRKDGEEDARFTQQQSVQIDQHTEGKTGEVMREGGEIVEEKAYEEHLLQQVPCKQRHAKKGNAEEDGFPV
jgi:hypothetical protein